MRLRAAYYSLTGCVLVALGVDGASDAVAMAANTVRHELAILPNRPFVGAESLPTPWTGTDAAPLSPDFALLRVAGRVHHGTSRADAKVRCVGGGEPFACPLFVTPSVPGSPQKRADESTLCESMRRRVPLLGLGRPPLVLPEEMHMMRGLIGVPAPKARRYAIELQSIAARHRTPPPAGFLTAALRAGRIDHCTVCFDLRPLTAQGSMGGDVADLAVLLGHKPAPLPAARIRLYSQPQQIDFGYAAPTFLSAHTFPEAIRHAWPRSAPVVRVRDLYVRDPTRSMERGRSLFDDPTASMLALVDFSQPHCCFPGRVLTRLIDALKQRPHAPTWSTSALWRQGMVEQDGDDARAMLARPVGDWPVVCLLLQGGGGEQERIEVRLHRDQYLLRGPEHEIVYRSASLPAEETHCARDWHLNFSTLPETASDGSPMQLCPGLAVLGLSIAAGHVALLDYDEDYMAIYGGAG